MSVIERKNYSFYAPTDLGKKLEQIQAKDDNLKNLSKSQALYAIISKLADECAEYDSSSQQPENF